MLKRVSRHQKYDIINSDAAAPGGRCRPIVDGACIPLGDLKGAQSEAD